MSGKSVTQQAQPTVSDASSPLSVGLTISAVVCTRDRPAMIARVVESIAVQDYSPFEVLVVDQSRSDETRRLIEPLAERYAHIRYLHLDRAGHSYAYNMALAHAAGTVLAFTDDDCVVSSNWLAAIAQAYTSQPDIALLYGQVLAAEDFPYGETGDGIIPALPIPARRRLNRQEGFEVFGMGANFAVRRSVGQALGGFDEVLGLGAPLKSSNDFDFAFRVFRGGHTILLEPDVIVYHYGFRSYAQWPQSLKTYGYGDGAFYMKHVRTGDVLAAWLLGKTLGLHFAREAKHTIERGRAGAHWEYVTHCLVGMKESFNFGIDRRKRLYRSGYEPAVQPH